MIALHMPMEWCLDYCSTGPRDQMFHRNSHNLKKPKVAAVAKVGNMFKGDSLTKRKFPSIITTQGKEASIIVCAFCLFACLIDAYDYKHLAALHLNILWGCGICFNFKDN